MHILNQLREKSRVSRRYNCRQYKRVPKNLKCVTCGQAQKRDAFGYVFPECSRCVAEAWYQQFVNGGYQQYARGLNQPAIPQLRLITQ